jgi:hypothetical protein
MLPIIVGIKDSAVQLMSTLGSVVSKGCVHPRSTTSPVSLSLSLSLSLGHRRAYMLRR